MTDHGIAGEAYNLVYGVRAETYGHPRTDFKIIAKLWTGLLQDKLKDGEELDEYRVAVMMTGLKLARLVKSPGHHDSRADTIGYMLTMERLDEVEDDVDAMGTRDAAQENLDKLRADVAAAEKHCMVLEAQTPVRLDLLYHNDMTRKTAFEITWRAGDRLLGRPAAVTGWVYGPTLRKWRNEVDGYHYSLEHILQHYSPLECVRGSRRDTPSTGKETGLVANSEEERLVTAEEYLLQYDASTQEFDAALEHVRWVHKNKPELRLRCEDILKHVVYARQNDPRTMQKLREL